MRQPSIRNTADPWSLLSLHPHLSEAFGRPSRFPARLADIDIALTSSLGGAQSEIPAFQTQRPEENPAGRTSRADRWSSQSAALSVRTTVLPRQKIFEPRASSEAPAVFSV